MLACSRMRKAISRAASKQFEAGLPFSKQMSLSICIRVLEANFKGSVACIEKYLQNIARKNGKYLFPYVHIKDNVNRTILDRSWEMKPFTQICN